MEKLNTGRTRTKGERAKRRNEMGRKRLFCSVQLDHQRNLMKVEASHWFYTASLAQGNAN